jgi:hypothetical protein
MVPVTGADKSGGEGKKSTATGEAAGDTKSSVKRLDGVTSIDDKVFLECEVLAYAAVGTIAAKVATEVEHAIPPGAKGALLAVAVAQDSLVAVANANDALLALARAKDAPPEVVQLKGALLAVAEVKDALLVIADRKDALLAVALNAAHTPLIVLLDDELMSAFRLFASLTLQLALFEKGFASVAPVTQAMTPSIAASLSFSAVTGAVAGVVDLLGQFRQDTQFFGRAVSIRETALYIELAHAFRKEGFQVLYPRLLSYQALQVTQPSHATLTKLFDGVFEARQEAAQRLRPLLQSVADLEQEILDRRREFPDADAARQKVLTNELQDLDSQLVNARKHLDPDLVLFENTDAQWNELQKGLVRADEKSGHVPMQLIVRVADVLAVFMNSPHAYFCYANAVVAGGTMRIRRNLLRTLFCGDALEFSGGAVVSYALLDGNAHILAARTHRHITDFRGFPRKAPVWTNFNT